MRCALSIDVVNIFKLQEAELAGLTQRLNDLKRRYELYFMGMEKREPGLDRERLERDIRATKLHRTQKTELRFKFQQYLARYRIYTQHWSRVCREIEEGTFRRGAVTPAERLAARQTEVAMKRAQGVDPDDVADSDAASKGDASREEVRISDAANAAAAFLAQAMGRKPTGTPVKAAPPAPAAPRRPSGVSALYTDFIEAKKSRGEDVSKVSYAAFQRSVDKQRQKACEKLGSNVDLRVKVTGEKVTLVASRGAPAKPKAVAPAPPAAVERTQPKAPSAAQPAKPTRTPPPPPPRRVVTVPPPPMDPLTSES
ncbi:MAG: hypothetical protein ACI9OJ_003970 [Myxococcota bacterium]|jgi:hypothetical protein